MFTPFAFVKTTIAAVPQDQDVTNFFNRVTANGGSLTSTEQSAITTLVSDLKADNIWNDCQAIYPCVGSSAASNKVNLKNTGSFELGFNGGITFSSDGFSCNGSTGYADTGWQPSNAAGTNDIHLGIMLFVDQNVNTPAIAASHLPHSLNIYPRHGGSNVFTRINSEASSAITTVGTSKNLYLARRINSTEIDLYLNGTAFNQGRTSDGQAPYNVSIGRITEDDSGYYPSDCCFATLGDGLSNTQMADYSTAIQAFQTTLGGLRPY